MVGGDDRNSDAGRPWVPQPARAAAWDRGPRPAWRDPSPTRLAPSDADPPASEVDFEAEPGTHPDLDRRGIVARVELLEVQAEAHRAEIESLVARSEAAHAASVEAISLLAGKIVAQLDDQIAGLQADLTARHREILARFTRLEH